MSQKKFRNLEKSNLKAPQVSDTETQRAIEAIYKDLNELIDGVRNTKGSVTEEYDGNPGDIRIVKSKKNLYTLEAKGEEGWVTASINGNPIGYTPVGSRSKQVLTDLQLQESQASQVGETGATGATGQQGQTGATGATGAQGPPGFGLADFDSEWYRVELDDFRYDKNNQIGLNFNHNLGELPYIIKVYYAPDYYNSSISGTHGALVPDIAIDSIMQINTTHLGSSTGGQGNYGISHLCTENEIRLLCGGAKIAVIPKNLEGGNQGTEYSTSGAVKVLLWRTPNS